MNKGAQIDALLSHQVNTEKSFSTINIEFLETSSFVLVEMKKNS